MNRFNLLPLLALIMSVGVIHDDCFAQDFEFGEMPLQSNADSFRVPVEYYFAQIEFDDQGKPRLIVTVSIDKGWHTNGLRPKDIPFKSSSIRRHATSIKCEESGSVAIDGEFILDNPKDCVKTLEVPEEDYSYEVWEGKLRMSAPVVITEGTPDKDVIVIVNIRLPLDNDRIGIMIEKRLAALVEREPQYNGPGH